MAQITLITLGRTDLTSSDGRTILSVLTQPKRFALLVYLAVEGSRGLIRRDRLAAIFWPEHDQSSARANLRRSLYWLRRALGQGVVLTRGDEEVGVDGSLLRSDVSLLLGRVGGAGAERPEGGTFLEGFHFSGASAAWEDWLEDVREQVRLKVRELDSLQPSEARPSPPLSATPTPEAPAPRTSAQAISPTPSGRRGIFGSPVRPVRRGRAALGLLGLVGILLLGLAWAQLRGPDWRSPLRYDRIVLGSGGQFPRVVHRHYALPPDGSGILFRDTIGGRQGSWWKAANRSTPAYMREFDDAVSPVFSPDGSRIAFARDGHLLTQSPDGAVGLLVADSVSEDWSPGIAWGPGGTLLYEDVNHNLRRASSDGQTRELVASAAAVGQVFHVGSLPDGAGVLVTGCDGSYESNPPRLSFVDFQRDRVVDVASGIWMAWPMDDGRVVTVDTQGTVAASSFEPTKGTLSRAVHLLDGIRVSPYPEMALGRDGSILYIPGGVEPNGQRIVWAGRDGDQELADPTWSILGSVRSLSLSPDGDRLALGIRGVPNTVGEQVWIKDLPVGPPSLLTHGPRQGRRPVWSPDGKAIAFITQFQREDSAWTSFASTLPSDASAPTPKVLLQDDRTILEIVLANDGHTVVLRTGDAGRGQGAIAYAALSEDPSLQSLFVTDANEYGIDLSPDDHWLAYVSEESGHPQVYVRPFPGPGDPVQVSRNGGTEPRWAHGGKELFFRSPGVEGADNATPYSPGYLVAAGVRADSVFQLQSLTRLFPDDFMLRGSRVRLYDVSADDQRFIGVAPFMPTLWTQGNVIYSPGWYWSDEIRARLGEG